MLYPPMCVNATENIPFVCSCSENLSSPTNAYVNCTPASAITPFTSVSGSHCIRLSRRRRRDNAFTTLNDYMLPSDYIQGVTFSQCSIDSQNLVWPTAGGIAYSQADSVCRGRLQNLTTYTQCATYVDVNTLVLDCVFNIAVSGCGDGRPISGYSNDINSES